MVISTQCHQSAVRYVVTPLFPLSSDQPTPNMFEPSTAVSSAMRAQMILEGTVGSSGTLPVVVAVSFTALIATSILLTLNSGVQRSYG